MAAYLKDNLDRLSPATEVATVADISLLLTQGYVIASTRKGPITVMGCSPGVVVPGTDIFVRRISNTGINQYVFDGLVSPTLVGPASYSVVSYNGTTRGASTGTLYTLSNTWTPGTGATNIPGNSATGGWFWS
ncbi:MAG TPA: hypothetical protein VH593_29785, partial [Ktedonobacteraceae bacterium]